MYTVEQSHLVAAYGDFFSQWPWNHYATFTFGRKLSESACERHWDNFINSLGRLTRGRVGWVRADERRWSGSGNPEIPLHYHALLMYKNPPTPEPVMDLWKVKAGDAKVEIYDCSRGAAWYIVKIFPYEGASYDLGGLDSFTGSSPSGHQAVQ